ncbi:hypothetical protein FB45DRAFT_1143572 [Roridomyces roridus]|uniref:Kinesin light chain n=1 Tax=Roridomyces roridus TaxID=1738132 RepID=A0AAD7C0L0_9AGAR|nr:hypothetical protein FB45DRAFT_1143572 [Roridomyces roridus]
MTWHPSLLSCVGYLLLQLTRLLRFSDIFLLDMSSQTTIETGLKNIAIIKRVGSTQEDAMKWLRDVQSNWFLLFDNADDPNINLNPYLPRCNQGNILITSRNPGLSVHAGAHWLVSDMEESDAVVLLLKGAAKDVTDKNMKTAREICKENSRVTWNCTKEIGPDYWVKSPGSDPTVKMTGQRAVTTGAGPAVQPSEATILTAGSGSGSLADGLEAQAVTALTRHDGRDGSDGYHPAVLRPRSMGISETIFQNAARYSKDNNPDGPSKKHLRDAYKFIANFQNQAGQWDSLAFIEVATELQAYALIGFDEETAFFSIHPLVHGWCQQWAVNQVEVMINLMGMSIYEGHYSDAESIGMLPHLWTLIRDRVERAPLWNAQFAETYSKSFKFGLATEFWGQVWRERQDRYGENHPATLSSMEHLGISYLGLGQFSDALPLQTLVLEKHKKLLGEEHPETLRAMGNLAVAHKELGALNDALPLETLVLEKQKKLLVSNFREYSRVASSCTQRVGILASCKLFLPNCVLSSSMTIILAAPEASTAAGAFRLLFHVQPSASCFSNSSTAIKSGSLAHWLTITVEWADCSLSWLRSFVTVPPDEQVVTDRNRHTLRSDCHMPACRVMPSDAGDQIAYLGLFRELTVARRIFASIKGSLAITHKELGEFNDALLLEVLVLEKRKKLLGEEHPHTLSAMGNLANTHKRLGEFNDALLLEVLVLEKRKKLLGEEHPDTLFAMGNLAGTHKELGQFNNALLLETLVLEKRKKLLGEEHPATLSAMRNLANTHRKLGDFNDALPLEVLVLEKRRKLLGEEHPDTLMAMGNLACTHSHLGQFNDALPLETLPDDALPLETFVLEKRKKLLGEEHPDTLTAMKNLIKTYKGLGKVAELDVLNIQLEQAQATRDQ